MIFQGAPSAIAILKRDIDKTGSYEEQAPPKQSA